MIDPDFEKLATIYEERSLSKAALRIGISQSALSKILNRIEEKARVPLFTRTNRGLIATEACEKIYSFSKEQELKWRALSSQVVGKQSTEPAGYVRIAAHPAVYLTFAKALGRLLDLAPNIQIDFSMLDSVEATQKVLSGHIDLALIANPMQHMSLIINRLVKERVAGFQKKKTQNIERVFYNPDMIQSHSLIRKIKTEELIALRNYELVATLSKHGNSMAILPESVAKRHSLNEMVTKPFFEAQLSLIRLQKSNPSRAEEKVISIFREEKVQGFLNF